MASATLTIPRLDITTDLLTTQTLTLGEAKVLEKLLGIPFPKIDGGSAEALSGLVWLSARRVNRAITLDDIDGLTFDDLVITMPGGEAAEDPSQPADPAAAEDGDPTTSTPDVAGTSSD